jgi:hypothetical protein
MASCSRAIKNLTKTSGANEKTKNNDNNVREEKQNQDKYSTYEEEKNYTARLFIKVNYLK